MRRCIPLHRIADTPVRQYGSTLVGRCAGTSCMSARRYAGRPVHRYANTSTRVRRYPATPVRLICRYPAHPSTPGCRNPDTPICRCRCARPGGCISVCGLRGVVLYPCCRLVCAHQCAVPVYRSETCCQGVIEKVHAHWLAEQFQAMDPHVCQAEEERSEDETPCSGKASENAQSLRGTRLAWFQMLTNGRLTISMA